MRKCEELADLINTKHPEWKNLTVRGLKEISDYSFDSSRLALNIVNPKEDQSIKKKKPNHTKNNGKKTPPETPLNNNLEKMLDDFTTLNSETLEKLLVNALKKHPDNANLLGKAIEFFLKIKGKTDAMNEEWDMEELGRIGLLRTKEGSEIELFEE